MTRCQFVVDSRSPRLKRCAACRTRVVTDDPPERIHSACSGPAGVGTLLAAAIAELGLRFTASCGCEDYARELDRRGPAWCTEHAEEIVARLCQEAVQLDLPFAEFGAYGLLSLAIDEARQLRGK